MGINIIIPKSIKIFLLALELIKYIKKTRPYNAKGFREPVSRIINIEPIRNISLFDPSEKIVRYNPNKPTKYA